jgi:hypothetical protein
MSGLKIEYSGLASAPSLQKSEAVPTYETASLNIWVIIIEVIVPEGHFPEFHWD